jgi:hypothetical protein
VVSGWYIAVAHKAGCLSPDHGEDHVETEVLPVPPIHTDLDLRLDCPDVTPPVLTFPADITVEATSASGAAVSYEVTAIDARDGAVPVSCEPPSGSTFPLGFAQVTCEASDAAGNVAAGSFGVTVEYSWSGVLQPINAARLFTSALREASEPAAACSAA